MVITNTRFDGGSDHSSLTGDMTDTIPTTTTTIATISDAGTTTTLTTTTILSTSASSTLISSIDMLNSTLYRHENTTCLHRDQLLEIVQQYTNQMFWFPAPTVIILVIFYCLVVFLGVLGNVLIIIVIGRRRDLRSSKNLYILNLSVCDVIMSAVCMPFSLAKLTLKKWTLGPAMCRVIPALATIDVFVSTFTIVAIALDRYLSIMHARQMRRRLVLTMLVVIWVVSILLSTPLFCFHTIETQEVYDHVVVQQCIDNWPDDLFREIYTTTVMLFQYLTPSAVISFLHARICTFLTDRHDDRPGCDTQIAARIKSDMKRHRKNMVLLTAMSLIFSITWLPLTILNIVADLDHEAFKEKQYNLLHAISLLIAMSSSALNPIMYGWYNSNIRRAFGDLVRISGDSKASEADFNRKQAGLESNKSNGREKSSRRKGKSDNKYSSSCQYDPVAVPSSPGQRGSEASSKAGSTVPRCTKMVRAVVEKSYNFTDNKSFCSEEPSPSEKADSNSNGKKETDSLKCSEKNERYYSYDSIAMTCD